MVEFLVGLVGIVVIMLALHLVATIVYEDFDSLIGSRQEVAEALIYPGVSGRATYGGSGTYQPADNFYAQLLGNIRYDGTYSETLQLQPVPYDGFAPVAAGEPLESMVGVEGGQTIEVGSPLLRRVLGGDIVINNAVWMPPWDDLMGE